MAERRAVAAKQSFLNKALRSIPNVNMRNDSWNSALFQGVLSRGDRSIASVLTEMAKKNISFKKAVMNCNIKTDRIFKGFGGKNLFPWEIIRHRVKKSYLLREWKRAGSQKQTSFCDTTACRRCGACRDGEISQRK
jgi:hypothetical protein